VPSNTRKNAPARSALTPRRLEIGTDPGEQRYLWRAISSDARSARVYGFSLDVGSWGRKFIRFCFSKTLVPMDELARKRGVSCAEGDQICPVRIISLCTAS
jgi:hypothetical protein